ncbi:MAG: hypothetical protein ACOYON_13845 [Fimbriimonas sp.]
MPIAFAVVLTVASFQESKVTRPVAQLKVSGEPGVRVSKLSIDGRGSEFPYQSQVAKDIYQVVTQRGPRIVETWVRISDGQEVAVVVSPEKVSVTPETSMVRQAEREATAHEAAGWFE